MEISQNQLDLVVSRVIDGYIARNPSVLRLSSYDGDLLEILSEAQAEYEENARGEISRASRDLADFFKENAEMFLTSARVVRVHIS